MILCKNIIVVKINKRYVNRKIYFDGRKNWIDYIFSYINSAKEFLWDLNIILY